MHLIVCDYWLKYRSKKVVNKMSYIVWTNIKIYKLIQKPFLALAKNAFACLFSNIWYNAPELIFWLCQYLELTWSLLNGELSQAHEQVSLLNESGSKQWAGVTLKHWQPHSSCSSRTSSWNDKCTFNHRLNSWINIFKICANQEHNFFWLPEKKLQLF